MLLFYFDEVKFDPPNQTSFWMGGICVEDTAVSSVEREMNDVSEAIFGSRRLSSETEFHGKEIVQGNGLFKGVPVPDRMKALARILSIGAREDVMRIYVRINPLNFVATSDRPDEVAFMYFVEMADRICSSHDCYGMMFGDYDEPAIGPSVANLSQFRETSTRWRAGRRIERLIDTVHFAKSHHSRLIQLADVCLYCMQFAAQDNTSQWRAAAEAEIRSNGGHLSYRYHEWPRSAQWYR